MSLGLSVALDSAWPRSACSMPTSRDSGLWCRRVQPGQAGDGAGPQPWWESGTGLLAGPPSTLDARAAALHESTRRVYSLELRAAALRTVERPAGLLRRLLTQELGSPGGAGLWAEEDRAAAPEMATPSGLHGRLPSAAPGSLACGETPDGFLPALCPGLTGTSSS